MQTIKPHERLCFCMLVMIVAILIRESHQKQQEKQVMFYPLGSYVDVDVNVIPTYFYESGQYFRGYFEVHYHDDEFDYSGRQQFTRLTIPRMNSVPSAVTDHQLTCQYSLFLEFSRNVSAPVSNKKQTVTIKFFPTFNLNVDPYSVRIYSIEADKTPTSFQFTPLFPNSDNMNSTLGPWDVTISLSDYPDAYISKQIVFFAYRSIEETLSSIVPIKYPRDVLFKLNQYEMHILYPNATVLDPSQPIVPKVMVSNYENQLEIPESYVLLGAYTIEEDNKDAFQMDEIRTINHRIQIYQDHAKVDDLSLKCAYATSDSDFKKLRIDPSSTSSYGIMVPFTYTLSCNQIIPDSRYVMAVIGKVPSLDICAKSFPCAIDPLIIREYQANPKIQVSFKPDTQLVGSFKLNDLDFGKYKNVKNSPSSQSGLSVYYVFELDLSQSSLNPNIKKTDNSQNEVTVNVEPEPLIGVDPYSCRLFKLNSAGDLFELVSDDIPRLSHASFSLDLTSFVQPNTPKKIIFGLFSFAKADAAVGEVVYAHYPREVSYSLGSHVNMKLYFKPRYSTPILYESRPYFTINNYTPSNMKGMDDYEVLYSFLQQNGNGLETLGIDEGRKFIIDFDTNVFRFLKIKFTDLKGGYLFKESNFEQFEESSAKVVLIPNSKQLVIDFQEDIRDVTFAFILVGKPFVPNVYLKELNSLNALIPTDMNRFNSQELPMDTLTVSFNPNSRSHGNYILKVDQRKYSDYSLPKTQLQPLTLVGSYIIDTSNISTFSNLAIDTQLDLIYEKNSINRNLDPFSYRFFSVDDENQAFNWLECDDSQTSNPWKLSIDIAIFPKLKFAVFVYNNAIGEFGKQYSIHYERSLKYELSKNNNFELVFSSKSFPQLNNGVTFILNEKSDSSKLLEGYVKVKSFSIIQTVKSDISTDRLFSYDTKMQDENGNKISDLDSLQCVYITSERILYGSSSITKTDSIYTLQCPETILQEEYSLVIIAKSSKPINPQTSTNTDRNNDGEHATVVALGLCVAFLTLCVIALIVLVIFLLVRKKNPITKEKIFNFEEMKGYNSIEL